LFLKVIDFLTIVRINGLGHKIQVTKYKVQ